MGRRISRMDSSVVTSDNDQQFGIQNSSMGEKFPGLLEELTISNVQSVADEIMKFNLIQLRAQFCEAIMKAQMKFPQRSNIYAALVAIINSDFPDAGLLLVKRVTVQFKQAYGCGNKERMEIATKLLAHLVNQRVVNVVLAMDVLLLLLGNPSSDNVGVAMGFCMESGPTLLNTVPWKLEKVMEEFRGVLREGLMVEEGVEELVVKLLGVEKLGFRECPGIVGKLDLVEVGEQVTHMVSLLHDIDVEDSLQDSCISSGSDDDDDEASSWMVNCN